MRGKVILPLVVRRAPRHDGLAADLEALERRGDLAQDRQSGALQVVQHQDDTSDPGVCCSGVEDRQHIAQLCVLRFLPGYLRKYGGAQSGSMLLDYRALEIEHQRCLVVQCGRAAFGHGDHERDHQCQEQQVKDQAASRIEQAPELARASG